MFHKHLALGAVCVFGLGATAHAALVASDSFETYAAGSNVISQNGGSTGWTSAWVSNAASGDTDIVTQTLSAGGQSGGDQALHMENLLGYTPQNEPTNSNIGYALSRSFSSISGTTYASFLVRSENLGGNEFINFYLSDALVPDGDGPNEMAGVGLKNSAGNPFFARYGSSAQGTTATTSINATTDPAQDFLVVMKLSKTTTNFYDALDLWVFDANSTMPATESTPTATANDLSNMNDLTQFSVRVLNLADGESLLIDNVRIGTTWDAVVVPEPASLLLLAPAVLLLRPRNESR